MRMYVCILLTTELIKKVTNDCISRLSRYIKGNLNILEANYKFEEITRVYLIFCAFGGFYFAFVERKRQCLIAVY